jgi:hypothetical protein
MGRVRDSVFVLIHSQASAVTRTGTGANTLTYTRTGTASAASIGAFRDELSRRPGHVIQGNLR